MKKTTLFLVFLLTVGTFFAQQYIPYNGVKDNAKQPIALIKAIIHVNSQTTLNNGTLIIKDGKILAVGENLKPPKNAIVYELVDKHIYASFIDLYSSYGISKPIPKKKPPHPQYSSSKQGPYYWNESIKSEYNGIDDFQFNQKQKNKLLKKGFGVVLSHREDGVLRGSGFLTSLNKASNTTTLDNHAANFYSFKKGTSHQAYPSSLMGCIALIKQFFLDAIWYKQTNPAFKDLSIESHLKSIEKPQIFITSNAQDILRVNKISEEFEIDYIIKTGGDEFERIQEIKNAGLKLIVPINFPKAYNVENPYDANRISTQKLRHWKYAPFNLSILEKNQLNFSITSNGLSAKDFISNLRLAISKGLSKEAAYKALTETPAAFIQKSNSLGTLEKGKWANLIVTSDELFEKNGTLLENWIQGKQHIISDLNADDIRGKYNLNINQNIRTLIVKGSKEKPKASIQYNIIKDSTLEGVFIIDSITGRPIKITKKKTVPVTIKHQGKQITLAFKLNGGNYGLSGIVNFNSGSWDGNGLDPNGEWFKWSAIRKEKPIVKEKKPVFTMDTSAFHPLLPPVAYGFDSLPKPIPYLIKNTTVWTSEKEGILYNTDVLINEGKITHIGNILDVVDPSTIVIDGTNKHLTAGIIDEHSHIAISRGVNEASHSVTAEVDLGDVINPNDINIYRQLAGGVTTAQLLHGSANPIGGQSAIIKLRWGSSGEEMKFKPAPKFIKFALGENVKQSNWGDRNTIRFPQTRMGVEQVYYDAFLRAKKYGERWEEYRQSNKKGKQQLPIPRKDLQLEILLEILNKERFITCHSYVQSEINMLMKVADSLNFTLNTFTHILEGYKVADKMKAHGAGGSTFSDWWAYKYEVKDAIPYNASLLNQMGITVAVNSDDAEMGRRLNQEAAKGIKYGGMKEEEALNMITINPAKLLHIDHIVGSIKEGKDADLVLWSQNPLSVYAKVEKTFIDGKLYFDLDTQNQRKMKLMKQRSELITEMMAFKNAGGKVQKLKAETSTSHNCSTIKDDGNE